MMKRIQVLDRGSVNNAIYWVLLGVCIGGLWSTVAEARAARGIMFEASWCHFCRDTLPAVRSLIQQGYPIDIVDTDQQPQMSERYGVSGLPTFVLVDESGNAVRTLEGAQSEASLRSFFRDLNPNAAPQSHGNSFHSTRPAGPKPGTRRTNPAPPLRRAAGNSVLVNVPAPTLPSENAELTATDDEASTPSPTATPAGGEYFVYDFAQKKKTAIAPSDLEPNHVYILRAGGHSHWVTAGDPRPILEGSHFQGWRLGLTGANRSRWFALDQQGRFNPAPATAHHSVWKLEGSNQRVLAEDGTPVGSPAQTGEPADIQVDRHGVAGNAVDPGAAEPSGVLAEPGAESKLGVPSIASAEKNPAPKRSSPGRSPFQRVERPANTHWSWAAAIQSALLHFGIATTQEELAQRAFGSAEDRGIGGAAAMVALIRQFGLSAEYRADLQDHPEELQPLLASGKRVLALVKDYRTRTVLIAGNAAGDAVLVADPDVPGTSMYLVRELISRLHWRGSIVIGP